MSQTLSLQERNKLVSSLTPRKDPLPAPEIEEADDNGVISYEALQGGLTMRLPYVDGMARGDEIIVGISSNVGGVMFADTIKGGDADELVHFAPDKVKHLQGADIEAWYQNFSWLPDNPTSPGRYYSVQGRAYDPVIKEAVGGVIPYSAVIQGATLSIRSGLAMTEGSIVSVYFGSDNSAACFTQHFRVQTGDVGKDVEVPVPASILEMSVDRRVHLIYIVNGTQGQVVSRLVSYSVEGEIGLPKPLYPGEDGAIWNDRILPVDESGKTPMTIETSGMVEGDQVTMFYGFLPFGPVLYNSTSVKPSDVTRGHVRLDFSVLPQSGRQAVCMAIVERPSGRVSGSIKTFTIS